MKIENQVCTLEQAKRLSELGVTADALFYWYELHLNGEVKWQVVPYENWEYGKFEENQMLLSALAGVSANKIYPAYTVAELGELLPELLIHDFDFKPLKTPKSGEYELRFVDWFFDTPNGRRYNCAYRHRNNINIQQPEESFTAKENKAQARAAMLIYLLENKIHTI